MGDLLLLVLFRDICIRLIVFKDEHLPRDDPVYGSTLSNNLRLQLRLLVEQPISLYSTYRVENYPEIVGY